MGVLGVWVLLLLPLRAAAQAQVCSVDKTVLEVKENTEPSEPLLDIYVPEGQQVTLGPSSTPFAFKIQGTQLFLNVTPDYEENTVLQAHLECLRGDTVVSPAPAAPAPPWLRDIPELPGLDLCTLPGPGSLPSDLTQCVFSCHLCW